MKSVRLFGYAASPYNLKTWCFLQYKDIDFQFIPVNPNPNNSVFPEIAFTDQTQIPVLQIDGEWRLESSHHAYWLDEVFPDKKPLCPAQHAEKVKTLDKWVDDFIVATNFLYSLHFDAKSLPHELRAACWRMGMIANATHPISPQEVNDWPRLAFEEMHFAKHMGRQLDRSGSLAEIQEAFFGELVGNLGDGPFFGGLDVPTMLDFSLAINLVQGYLVGAVAEISAAKHPAVKAWLKRVAEHLPANPTPHPDEYVVYTLEQGLA